MEICCTDGLGSALRIINLFALRGLIPERICMTATDGAIDLVIATSGIDPAALRMIEARIDAMPCAYVREPAGQVNQAGSVSSCDSGNARS